MKIIVHNSFFTELIIICRVEQISLRAEQGRFLGPESLQGLFNLSNCLAHSDHGKKFAMSHYKITSEAGRISQLTPPVSEGTGWSTCPIIQNGTQTWSNSCYVHLDTDHEMVATVCFICQKTSSEDLKCTLNVHL